MGRNSVPDRWLDYKPVGKTIEGTRFIAFKVPLRQHISETVEDKNIRLDTKTLLQCIPNLGLIIDLTNTYKYYDPVESFEEKDIQYVKIMVPGHTVPDLKYRNMFKKAVEEFLKNNQNNDKLIGVHCTHGVNRTGFLICNYMVREMNIAPEDAMQRFEIARGHPIERENYKEFISANVGTEMESYNSSSEEDFKSKRPRQQVLLTNDYYMYKNESSYPNYKNDFDSSRPIRNSWREHETLHASKNKFSERIYKNDFNSGPPKNSWRENEALPLVSPEKNYKNNMYSSSRLPSSQNESSDQNYKNNFDSSRSIRNSWRERHEPPPSIPNESAEQNYKNDFNSRPKQNSWREQTSAGRNELLKRDYDNSCNSLPRQESWRKEHGLLQPGTEISKRLYQQKEQREGCSKRETFSNGHQETQKNSDNLSCFPTNRSFIEERRLIEQNNMPQSNNRFTARSSDINSQPNLNGIYRNSSDNINSRFAGNLRQSNNRNQYSKYNSNRDRTIYGKFDNNKKSHLHNGKTDDTKRRSMLDDLY